AATPGTRCSRPSLDETPQVIHGDGERVYSAGVPSAGFDSCGIRHRLHARQSLRHALSVSGISLIRDRIGLRAAHTAAHAGYSRRWILILPPDGFPASPWCSRSPARRSISLRPAGGGAADSCLARSSLT